MKNAVCIMIGAVLNLYISFSNMAILTLLVLPIKKQELSFYFLIPSSISFFQSTIVFFTEIFYFLG